MEIIINPMSKTLYSPRLSDDVVRALYCEGQRRRMPMTRLADDLLRQALGSFSNDASMVSLREDEPVAISFPDADAA